MTEVPLPWPVLKRRRWRRYLGMLLLLGGCGAESKALINGADATASGGSSGAPSDAGFEAGAGLLDQVCRNPQPLFQSRAASGDINNVLTDQPSGMQWCSDSSYHRVQVVSCELGWRRDSSCDSCDEEDNYVTDAGMACQGDLCWTVSGCVTSDDCSVGEACLCSAGAVGYSYNVNGCVPADCETDADCGDYECGVSIVGCGSGLYCHTADDECHGNADCPPERHVCAYTGTRWECVPPDDCD